MRAILPAKDETRLVGEFFGGVPGFFVEVGAFEPERWSQTYHLEQIGWTGILIEPQPDLAEKLRQQRHAKVYAVACSSPENSGKRMSLHLAGGMSSLEPHLVTSTVSAHGVLEVPVRTLDEILLDAGAPTPIDFLSIDVEGHQIEVLLGLSLVRWRPRLILLEDHVVNLDVHRFLRSHGYKWIRRTDLNAWYAPSEANMRLTWIGRLQFIRKYYLGTPFRRMRDSLRGLRARIRRPKH